MDGRQGHDRDHADRDKPKTRKSSRVPRKSSAANTAHQGAPPQRTAAAKARTAAKSTASTNAKAVAGKVVVRTEGVAAVGAPRGWFALPAQRFFRRAASPFLLSVMLHLAVLFTMGLAKLQWRREPARLLTISADTSEIDLQELPKLQPPLVVELNEPSPATDALSPQTPMLAPEIPDALSSAAETLAAPHEIGLSPLQAIASIHADSLATDLGSSKPKRTKRQKAVFFGLASPGNSFCFVVDSSRSMRGGKFDAARMELLRAVAAMGPQQSFFVLLFDQNVEAMELEPNKPASRPAAATVDNKKRLARWLAGTKMEPSAKPAKALEFALSLKTDVIFLLTDGELPEHIAPLIRERNQPKPHHGGASSQVVFHTIGLYSARGQRLLQRIARENGGGYRFVPKPPKSY